MEDSDEDFNFEVVHKYGITHDYGLQFEKLAFNKLDSDITVVCDGKSYFCHKVSFKYLSFTKQNNNNILRLCYGLRARNLESGSIMSQKLT